MFTVAQQVSMVQATGGVAVVDTAAAESSYGHFEELPEPIFDEGGGMIAESGPSVVVVNGAFTYLTPRAGVGRAVTVGGTSYTVRRPAQGPDLDGGLIRLLLAR